MRKHETHGGHIWKWFDNNKTNQIDVFNSKRLFEMLPPKYLARFSNRLCVWPFILLNETKYHTVEVKNERKMWWKHSDKKKQQTWLVCNRNAVRVVAVFWCLFLLFLAAHFLSDNKHQLGACFLASHSISQLNFSERRVRRFQLTKCGTKMQLPPTIGS